MIKEIEQVLEEKVRPALLSHEGDVQIVEYADGVLKIRHAADVCRLLRDVQDKVKEQFGVTLEPEVKFLGKF